MILQIQKHIRKVTLILIVLMIFLSLGAAGQDNGKCEKAFKKCMFDAARRFPMFSMLYVQSVYCFGGYFFCKKYLDK